jgi:hypothetical protein
MKKIGEYTCRGQIDARQPTRIQLFDGRFDTAYRIVNFETVIVNPTVNEEWRVCLTSQATPEGAAPVFDFSDNTQLAWAWGGNNYASGTGSATFSKFDIIDPENLIVQDIWIIGEQVNTTGANAGINYIITLEKYDISEAHGAITMVSNYSQGSDAYFPEPV